MIARLMSPGAGRPIPLAWASEGSRGLRPCRSPLGRIERSSFASNAESYDTTEGYREIEVHGTGYTVIASSSR